MFIQISKKSVLAVLALVTVGLLYLCFVVALEGLSSWAERELQSYPFKQEDWLRYLLPSKFAHTDRENILLTGPSTVRENLLYEEFEAAFPQHRVIQGGLSLGAVDDVTASLEYIAAAYGEQALPDLLVLGISPRFIGNIPADRPFKDGVERYSPYLSARQTAAGIQLTPKGVLGSLRARLMFLIRKQPERYRTTVIAMSSHWILGDADSARGLDGKTHLQRLLDRLFKRPEISRHLEGTQYQRALEYDFSEVLAWLISPYKYRLDPPIELSGLVEWMDEEDDWWQEVHHWDPRATRETTGAALARLAAIVEAHDIKLLIVNMPEREASRVRYDSDNYRAYLQTVAAAFPGATLLDLQKFLKDNEFHDLEHSKYDGSLRLTQEIIRHLKAVF